MYVSIEMNEWENVNELFCLIESDFPADIITIFHLLLSFTLEN